MIELPLSQMLKGNQKKIDANKDGKISKKDFLLLQIARAKKKKNGNKSAWFTRYRLYSRTT